MQPARVPVCQGPHVAEGGDVGVFPGPAPDEPGKRISEAEQQQRRTRQASDRMLGDDGRCGKVHVIRSV